ncbi:Kinase, NEK [Giardia lamblia P15]|uniref:Kinase, NEK n=1 Tax=Giardia intestinalis (strain P15) TaxID=658858 RepID=E1F038_GIAIA|nr:Kinase, NEK [Giardia lamblia P15]
MVAPGVPTGYEQLAVLGNGAFGKVYKVRRQSDGVIMALKIIDLSVLSSNAQEVLRNETELFSLLEHRNLVKCYETFQNAASGEQYVAMELCERSLKDLILECRRSQKHLPEKTIWLYTAQILQGVSYLHSRYKPNDTRLKCIIHRDLKPDNILLTGDSMIKICDFGISRPLGVVSKAMTLAGTYHYMAPEIIKGQKYTEKVDVWSIGCVVYELCTLKVPTFDTLFSSGQPPMEFISFTLPDMYSNELKKFIEWCLIIRQDDRLSVYELLSYPPVKAIIAESAIAPPAKPAINAPAENKHKIFETDEINAPSKSGNAVKDPGPSRSPATPTGSPPPKQSVSPTSAPPPAPAKNATSTPILLSGSIEEQPRAITRQVKKECYFDKNNNTNLMLMVLSGASVETIRANLHLCKFVNKDGETALHMAVDKQARAYVELLAPREATIRLREAVFSSVRNFPIKSKKLYNVSAMMLAALYGMSDIVSVLRSYESGLQSAEGYTALMLAILAGSTTSATLLLHEATRQTQRGETALIFAAKMGNRDLVDKLIPYETKVVTNYGSTALMEACRAGNMSIVKQLLPHEGRLVVYDMNVNLPHITKGFANKQEIKQLLIRLG